MKSSSLSSVSIKIVAFVAVVVVMILSYSSSVQSFPYTFEEGRIWAYETLVADFSFPIYKPNDRLREERESALKEYAPCFQTVGTSSSMIIISVEDMQMVRKGGYDHIAVVNRKHVSTDIPVEKILTPLTAYQITNKEMLPTLVYDSLTSNRLYQGILDNVSPTEGAVQAGETIIEHGEVISNEDYMVLSSLRKAYKNRTPSDERLFLLQLSHALLICLAVLLLVLYLFVFRKSLLEQTQAILFFCLLIILVAGSALLLMRYVDTSLVYLVPFAWVPILVRVFYDSRTAFVMHLVTVALVSISVPNPYEFLIAQVFVGAVVVDLLKDFSHRSQLAIAALFVVLSYSLVYTLSGLVYSGNIHQLDGINYLYFVVNGILVVMVYSLIFLFEKIFRLVSSITLVELSNINSDFMQEFARVAPGTFQHSLQVSTLASEAAKSIGAKALLVRTGALYHDLGKMVHPELYTENQSDEYNPLLSMSNREAAQTVISHVAEGEALARKNKIPDIIISFIRSHHGTSLVRFFYNSEINRVRQSSLSEDLIQEQDYRYPGPKPTTKEAAILMMADAIEARSRSLNQYTEQGISDMVDEMINLQIQDGQLSETPLSFHDLERVKQSFKERLITIYHRRIQYPTV